MHFALMEVFLLTKAVSLFAVCKYDVQG